MAKFLKLEQCPKCAERGRDRHGNNLATYADGSAYCFACQYYCQPSYRLKVLIAEEPANDKQKTLLPRDFTREIPAQGWKWLLQYGLPMSYWKAHCGFTPKENRIIFPIGDPVAFSCGRALTVGDSKWKVYGDKSSYVEVVGKQVSGEIVLVEDIISAHKVAQVTRAIPLFGTNIHDNVVKKLQTIGAPVALWLDEDQYTHLPKKIGRLQALLGASVRHIQTHKDPKEYNYKEIEEILLDKVENT